MFKPFSNRSFAVIAIGTVASLFLTGCASSFDELTDKAINAIGSRASEAMEDVDVKQVLKGVSSKVSESLNSMPETSSALKDTVSSLTSSILNDVSSTSSAANTEESSSPSEDGESSSEASEDDSAITDTETLTTDDSITESGTYTSKDDVAAYIHTYGHLPDNYITSEKAKSLGWDGESDLWSIQSGASLGGDDYANLAGLLPSAGGRSWKQCDVEYSGGQRGPERLCYSSDGLIYYSPDRFTTFVEITF